jgi:hypothetical protein
VNEQARSRVDRADVIADVAACIDHEAGGHRHAGAADELKRNGTWEAGTRRARGEKQVAGPGLDLDAIGTVERDRDRVRANRCGLGWNLASMPG